MSMKLSSILITGASSGIGRAVALYMARPNICLYLGGRDYDALVNIARECADRGASVEIKIIDVCDQNAMDEWIKSIGILDLVLACAGVTAGTVRGSQPLFIPEPSTQVRQIIKTNLDGVLNTVLPAIEVMQAQKSNKDGVRGRIAAISSVAGFVSSARAASYCASKAAVDRFMVASGGGLKSEGIHLSSICCGFVRTPMTAQNHFAMPGIVAAEYAAKVIVRGLVAKKRRIIFPVWLVMLARLVDLLPAGFIEKFYLRYLQEKEHKVRFNSTEEIV